MQKYLAPIITLSLAITAQAAWCASKDIDAAMKLYNQRNYLAAADAFEQVIKTSKSDAATYYYAALANRQARRETRAKQLFQYVVTYFPATTSAAYAQKAIGGSVTPMNSAASATPAANGDLPESVKAALSPEMRELLKTEVGKQIVKDTLKQQAGNLQTIKSAESQGVMNKAVAASAGGTVTAAPPTSAAEKKTAHALGSLVFTPEEIARYGASGVDQARYPNCWFEASMSALARLPRGQKLLSSMIKYGPNDAYVVRFPGDGVEYSISEQKLAQDGIHDKAKWASIIDCAQVMKFPNNQGSFGAYEDQSRLDIGMGCMTGCKAELISPGTAGAPELASFISGAVSSNNPIVCSTFSEYEFAKMTPLVVARHAYTIIGFDASKSMVILRNPHGQNSRVFSLPDDPNHLQFQQLDDGVVKMSIPLFQKYFYQACRSFI